MNLLYSVLFIFIGSFLINYFVISYVILNEIKDFQHSLGKIYISFIIASFIGFLQVIINDTYNFSFNYKYYCVFLSLLFIFILLYRKQLGINDNNHIRYSIENHSVDLLCANEIKSKTKNEALKSLISVCIKNNNEQMNDMKQLITIPLSKKEEKIEKEKTEELKIEKIINNIEPINSKLNDITN
jgi:hypothetical protein